MEIKVDYEDNLKLERLQYEVNARQSLLAYLIQLDIQKNDKFEKYHKEYLNFFTEYEKAKEQLIKKYIINNQNEKIKNWSLDFESQILTIEFY